METLVIGATGFIGSHVARALVHAKHNVRILRRSGSPTLALGDLPHEIVVGDLENVESLIEAMDGCEAVFNTAGYYPLYSLFDKEEQMATALRHADNFIEALKEVRPKRVIYTSSMSTMGYNPKGLSDENTPYDRAYFKSLYYDIKQAVEQRMIKAAHEGVPIVIMNPTGAFGDYDVKPTSGALIVSIAKEEMPAMMEGKINIVDAYDIAQAQVAALTQGKIGERYIIGGHNTTVVKLCRLIAEVAGVKPPRFIIPVGLGQIAATASEYIGHYILHQAKPLIPLIGIQFLKYGMHYDCTKAKTAFGMRPIPLEETIHRTVQWIRLHEYI